MNKLFRYLRNYRGKFSFAVVNSILNKLFDLMPPILTGWLIDTLGGDSPGWLRTDDPWEGALWIAGIIVLVFFLESFFEWLFQFGFRTLAQQVQHDLRMDAYGTLQGREISFFEKNRVGNLLAMLNDDINQLERFLNTGFNEILQLFVLVIFASIALITVNLHMALVGISAIPLIILGSIYYQHKIAPRYSKIREAVGELASRIENNLSGILVIKSFAAEKFEKNRVGEASLAYRHANDSAIRLSAAYVPLIRTFITFGFAGGLLLGSYWFIKGEMGISLGELTFYAMMIQRLLWPVTGLGRIFDEYERARASARRVFSLMENTEALPIAKNPVFPDNIAGNWRFDQVDFAYQADQPILKKLSLEIKAGQTIGIAGPTGAGKTTLIKLLLRLYDPQQGSVSLEGLDLPAWDITHLRQQIALVSQDTYLFHGTIRENIAYGQPEVELARIIEAASQAQLDEFVRGLPQGYDTIVGERGVRLSGGQRQRLSLARAILKNAPVIILDEATSSVDSETERAIQESMEVLVKDRTAIIIAHRLSTIRRADHIFVLQDGEVVEQGSHEALLLEGGVYAGLWRVQLGVGEF